MRRLGALALGALLASCLIAPPRPSGSGDAGGGDDDAGSGAICFGANDTAGAAIAVDFHGSGYESIYRGGSLASGAAVIWRFPPTELLSACAQALPLVDATPGAHVVALTSGQDGATNHLYALLASDGTNLPAEIHDLSGSDDAPVDLRAYRAPGLAPVPIPTTTGADRAAFIMHLSGGQLWFGGGTALGVVADGATTSTMDRADFGGAVGANEQWYLAAALGSSSAELVGAGHDIVATAIIGSGAPQVASQAATTDPCGSDCFDRVAHPIQRADLPLSAFIATGSDSTIAVFGNDGTRNPFVFPRPAGPASGFVLADAAVDTIVSAAAVDVAVLWTNPSEIAPVAGVVNVYPSLAQGGEPASNPITLTAAPTARRLVVVRAGSARHILVLADHPAQGEACLTYASGSAEPLRECD